MNPTYSNGVWRVQCEHCRLNMIAKKDVIRKHMHRCKMCDQLSLDVFYSTAHETQDATTAIREMVQFGLSQLQIHNLLSSENYRNAMMRTFSAPSLMSMRNKTFPSIIQVITAESIEALTNRPVTIIADETTDIRGRSTVAIVALYHGG